MGKWIMQTYSKLDLTIADAKYDSIILTGVTDDDGDDRITISFKNEDTVASVTLKQSDLTALINALRYMNLDNPYEDQ